MSAYIYPISLIIISALVAAAERLAPWRPDQRQLRPRLGADLLHLAFNGHFLGVIVYTLAVRHVLPPLDGLLVQWGIFEWVYRGLAAPWPVWVQIIVALLVIDLVHWCVHNLLHRVPWLWELHKTHHSVVDGEMDWIVSFRFQWTEVIVYKTIQYLPLAFFGFGDAAILTHAIFGTLIGHLNHANLDLGYGPLKYVLNSPRMHIWHHDYDANGRSTVNFGIIFSIWDWIFGTARLPPAPPARIGFEGVEDFPRGFLGQEAWPLQRLAPASARWWVGALVGASLIALGLAAAGLVSL